MVFVMLGIFFVLISAGSIGVVSASVEIIGDFDGKYYLGDIISSKVRINVGVDTYGLVGASLICDGFELDFYKVQNYLKQGTEKVIDLGAFPINEKMIGTCNVRVEVEDFGGNLLQFGIGESFSITNELGFGFEIDKENYLPEESVVVSGEVNKSGSYNLSIFLKGEEIIEKKIGEKFIEKIGLLNDSKGSYNVRVVLEDDFGNRGEKSIGFEVSGIVKRVEAIVSKEEVLPGETVGLKGEVYDQASEKISRSVLLKVFDPDSVLLEEVNLSSGEEKILGIDKYGKPGKYTLDVESSEIKDYKDFVVLEVRKLGVSIVENKVIIENVGNVRFIEEGFIDAKNGELIYQIPVEIDLGLGEKKEVDLTESLPEKSYTVSFNSSLGEEKVFENVNVIDNRPLSKKFSQRVSLLTGQNVIETDDQKNFFFGIILIIMLLGGMIILANDRLKARVVGKFKKLAVEEQEKGEAVRGVFGQYVGDDVLKMHEEGSAGMKKKEIGVLFADIRGFSKIFDEMDEVEVTHMLNGYFKKSNEIVKRHGGMVNKFVGDAIMALFNAPKEDSNYLMNSIRTGLGIKKEVEKLNVELKGRGIEPISIGMGIDFGNAAVGTLGSEKKMEYSAIGVPVNVSARLQGLAKDGELFITERVYQKLKGKIHVESKGEVALKNISGKVKIYSVKGLK